MNPVDVVPLPEGTRVIDPESEETWVVAYCEAVAHNDPFGPYAYGLVNDEDECVVFHNRLSLAQSPAILLPPILPRVESRPAA